MSAQGRRAAAFDVPHRLPMGRQHPHPIFRAIRRPVALEYLRQRYHGDATAARLSITRLIASPARSSVCRVTWV